MDHDGLVQIVRAHQAPVYRYLRFLGAAAALAEDLTQETFLVGLRQTDLATVAAPAAWLRGVARNLLGAHWRRRRDRSLTPEMLEQAEVIWASEFLRDNDGEDYVAALRLCLASLHDRDRQVLDLTYRDQASRATVSQSTGLGEDGVKSLLRRLRARLGECVKRRLGQHHTETDHD